MKKFGFVLATKMLIDGKKKVRFMYRETPDNSQDSGWRFFCGDEDDEYVNNPDNIGVYDIESVVAVDPDVAAYLDCIPGVAFEREDVSSTFRLSESFMTAKEV